MPHTPFTLSYNQLYTDLFAAFHCARRHKGSKTYVRHFERHLHDNLRQLCTDLILHRYQSSRSTCFCVSHPKKREVFAAEFRDRIVHHLIFNYLHTLLERTFIHDTYSCIKDRGTHYGIDRLEHHIRSCSHNYTQPAYVLKMDIRGYFMHIDRQILVSLVHKSILKMADRPSDVPGYTWRQRIDIPFLLYLTREVILLDPTVNCRRVGTDADWQGLPDSKSLFHTPEGCGLPIGNLTSQLFSNVYLNELDQFVKRTLGCKHYGRYVDDFYIVHPSRDYLRQIVPRIYLFLFCNLRLELNPAKTRITTVRQGVEFLGAYLKPHRRYISTQSLRRMHRQMQSLRHLPPEQAFSSINSYLGVLSHYDSYHIRRHLIDSHIIPPFHHYATINHDLTRLSWFPWHTSPQQLANLDRVITMARNPHQ